MLLLSDLNSLPLRFHLRYFMTRTIRVAVSFARFNKDHLNCFAMLALLCLRNNPLFPNPKVSLADLGALLTAYQDAMSAATLGGPKDSAALPRWNCATAIINTGFWWTAGRCSILTPPELIVMNTMNGFRWWP
jgi:hypothetical protein